MLVRPFNGMVKVVLVGSRLIPAARSDVTTPPVAGGAIVVVVVAIGMVVVVVAIGGGGGGAAAVVVVVDPGGGGGGGVAGAPVKMPRSLNDPLSTWEVRLASPPSRLSAVA